MASGGERPAAAGANLDAPAPQDAVRSSRMPEAFPMDPKERKAIETAVLHGRYPHYHEIIDGVLFLGNERSVGVVFPYERTDQKLIASLRQKLIDSNIGGIVSCVPREPAFESDFKYCHVPLGDNPKHKDKLRGIFTKSYSFIQGILKEKKAVLIHCNMGMSRSGTICIAYLMKRNRWSFERAYLYARGIRGVVSPNTGFCEALLSFEAELQEDGGKALDFLPK